MRIYEVKLFVYRMNTKPEDMRAEYIYGNSQEEAEEKAHNWYAGEGYGVYGSRPIFKKGDKVKWNDPAISDYDEADREAVLNRVFEIVSNVEGDDENEIIKISEYGSLECLEVYAHELELSEETPLLIKASVTKADIKKAEKVLTDNGIEADEAETVLQAIGYTLLGVELYGNEKSIELNNAKAK